MKDEVYAVFNQIKNDDYIIVFDKPTVFYLDKIEEKMYNKDYGIEFGAIFNPDDFYNKVMLELMDKFIFEGLPDCKVYMRVVGGNASK